MRRDRVRVLVVDDNATNRVLLARQMERLGCSVDAVADGDAAIARVRDEDFGLILMDCQMPDRDGPGTAREIRRVEAGRRRTPIVAVTANASAEDRALCLEAGMDEFLTKPTTLEALAVVLDQWDRPFDEAALAAFAAVAAETPEALGSLLVQFLADMRELLASLARARAADNLRQCAVAAHTMKGASSAVGARGLGELARRLELACTAPRTEGLLDDLLVQVEAELGRVASGLPGRR